MISIDPGVRYYACAYWDPGLVAVRLAPIDEPLAPGEHDLVLEKPQVYRHARARNSDIVDLAMSAAQVAAQGKRAVTWYLPREWKGQIPKPVHQDRIRAHLKVDEIMLLDGWTKGELMHILDAVGLGLVHLGRMRRP